MAISKTIINEIANEKEAVDRIVGDKSEQYKARQLEIIRDPAQRSAFIWSVIFEAFQMDPEKWAGLTMAEVNQIPAEQRGVDWSVATSAMMTATRAQAFIEVVGPEAFQLGSKTGEMVNEESRKLSRTDARDTALEGPGRVLAERQAEAKREAEANG